MFAMSLPWWEFLIRAIVVYAFLILILRLTGKRQVGQLAPFDLVLLLVLSNAVQNSMNGGDNSLVGGLISAVGLIGINWIVGYLTFKNKTIANFIEGKPQIIDRNGHIDRNVMNQQKMTEEELLSAMRLAGCADIAHVHFAVLENNGQISFRIKDS